MIPQIALARIGETPGECEKRYGKPVNVVKKGDSYVKRDYHMKGILVETITYKKDGICSMILYSNIDGTELETEMIVQLLKANEDKEWDVTVKGQNLMGFELPAGSNPNYKYQAFYKYKTKKLSVWRSKNPAAGF